MDFYDYENSKLIRGKEELKFYQICNENDEFNEWQVNSMSIKQVNFMSKMYVCPVCGCVFVELK
jgi:hypothetical protein